MREILVAEDNALLAKGICTALKSERYRVRHVADGAAALAAIAERRPDVLILDIKMGRCASVRRIVRQTARPSISGIMMSRISTSGRRSAIAARAAAPSATCRTR